MKFVQTLFYLIICASSFSQSTYLASKLEWGTYLGGGQADYIKEIVVSDNGFVYITGWTESSANIASTGSHQSSLFGTEDAFLAKFDNTGSLIWSTYFGGSYDDRANDLVLDSDGNIYITGETNSDSGIATIGTHDNSYNHSAGFGSDAFIAKFNPTGQLIWGTYFGGSGNDMSHTISVNDSAQLFIHGVTASTSSIATPGAHQTTSNWMYSYGFVAKFDSSGHQIWGTYYGTGSGGMWPQESHVDDSSNVYITGYTQKSTGVATSGSHKPYRSGGNQDVYLAKFSSQGVLNWATYYGSWSDEFGQGITTDEFSNVYLAGHTGSDSQITTNGSFQQYKAGGTDGFLVKFNSQGTRIWGTYYGGLGTDGIAKVIYNGSGELIINGSSSSDSGISTWGVFQPIIADTNGSGSFSSDAFIAKFDYNGNRIWSSYYGGTGTDFGTGIAIGPNEEIYVSGVASSDSGIAKIGSHQNQIGGFSDGFLAKLGECMIDSMSLNVSVCQMYTSPSGKYTWINSGDYTDTLTNQFGCDSVFFIHLHVTAPIIDSLTSNYVCDSGSVILNGFSPRGTIFWYSDSISLTPLDSGITFMTSNISNSTVYYVGISDSNCSHVNRWPITAEVISSPSIDSISDGMRCSSGKVNLFASADTGFVSWYSDSIGGLSLGNGQNFLTPTIFNSRFYYVQPYLKTCFGNRVAVFAEIIPLPVIDSTNADIVCDSGTANIQAYSQNGIPHWYYTAFGGSLIDTGQSISSPSIDSTTNFYVVSVDRGCSTISRTPVQVDVVSTPIISNIQIGSICDSGMTTLDVTKSNGTPMWFEDSTALLFIKSGRYFTTPSLLKTTSYYVFVDDNGCRTDTIEIKAEVHSSFEDSIKINSCRSYVLPDFSDTVYSSGLYTAIFSTTHGCDSLININLSIDTINTDVELSSTEITALSSKGQFQWINCDDSILLIGEKNKTYTPLNNGSYAVIIDVDGCIDTSDCTEFSWVNIQTHNNSNFLKLFPNPTSNLFQIETSLDIYEIQIFNPLGRQIFSSNNIDQLKFYLSEDKGVYLIRLKTENGWLNSRIVKH